MSALVIKEWKASNQPDSKGNYIKIVGRQGGLLSWLLALLKVDPTTTIKVTQTRVEFAAASLSGTEHRMIPIGNVCSTYYGYHKPWKAAVFLFLLLSYFSVQILGIVVAAIAESMVAGVIGGLFGIAIAAAIALAYYFLSRKLTLGFVEHSSAVSAIRFKRSVIENVDVNEKEARYICELTQFLIESAKSGL
ncbi:MAG: hypothetical protein NTY01_25005 [Verrucomicrobia bacterium]|nr:hypothetical protein [Verrucomicrobiota bacterium]